MPLVVGPALATLGSIIIGRAFQRRVRFPTVTTAQIASQFRAFERVRQSGREPLSGFDPFSGTGLVVAARDQEEILSQLLLQNAARQAGVDPFVLQSLLTGRPASDFVPRRGPQTIRAPLLEESVTVERGGLPFELIAVSRSEQRPPLAAAAFNRAFELGLVR